MVKVGIIGFGLGGQAFHAPVIAAVSGLKLTCILERSGSLAQQKYPGVKVTRTLDEFLADPDIRLCVVTTPHPSHFDLARHCLLAGRDVVVDKPFTANLKEAEELVKIAEGSGRLLTVYQNRRFDGDFKTVRKIISSGALGRIVAYESHYDRFRPNIKPNDWHERPGQGTGTLFDLGPHLIDQAFTLFGVPQAITAQIMRLREGSQVNDAFDLRFEYEGMSATVRSSMLASTPRPRFLIHGAKGSFVKYGMDPQEGPLRQGNSPLFGDGWGEDPEENWGTLRLQDGDALIDEKVKTEIGDYRGFYENVRDAVLDGKPLVVSPSQGLNVMRALGLAQTSSDERRTIRW